MFRRTSGHGFGRAAVCHAAVVGRCASLPLGLLGAICLLCAPGCERPAPPTHYSAYSGTVESYDSKTGDLVVNVVRRSAQGDVRDGLNCLVTAHSELYLNDRICTLSEISAGDQVELIGYRDARARLENFVVTSAHFDHPVEPPHVPDFLNSTAPDAAPRVRAGNTG